jgi:hypothetical protein
LTGPGQPDTARMALQKRDAEVGLELPDLDAEGGLRDTQR